MVYHCDGLLGAAPHPTGCTLASSLQRALARVLLGQSQTASPLGYPPREGSHAVGTRDVQEGRYALLSSAAHDAQLAPYCMVDPGGQGGGGDVRDTGGRGEANLAHGCRSVTKYASPPL